MRTFITLIWILLSVASQGSITAYCKNLDGTELEITTTEANYLLVLKKNGEETLNIPIYEDPNFDVSELDLNYENTEGEEDILINISLRQDLVIMHRSPPSATSFDQVIETIFENCIVLADF